MKTYKLTRLYLSLGFALVASLLMNVAFAEIEYRVRYSDNLDRIVTNFYPERTLTKKQIMVSIFAQNSHAFNKGNIHFLLRGKKLVLPDENGLVPVSAEDAVALILSHAEQLRDESTSKEKNKAEADAEKKQLALREEMAKSKKKQTQKIHQLETEGEALRLRLEKLLVAKDKREGKLAELEIAIQKSLEQPQVSFSTEGMSREEVIRTQRLKEQNKVLQQKLQESRSALAENSRSKISLERRLKDLKNKPKQEKSAVITTKVDEASKAGGDEKIPVFDLSSKVIWLIPLFLLAGFWYLFSWIKKSKKRHNISYDDDLTSIKETYLDANEDFNPNYEEDSLEAGIKIDVANAYLEAGDVASAQDVLKDVIKEGSANQREAAQKTLDTL